MFVKSLAILMRLREAIRRKQQDLWAENDEFFTPTIRRDILAQLRLAFFQIALPPYSPDLAFRHSLKALKAIPVKAYGTLDEELI